MASEGHLETMAVLSQNLAKVRKILGESISIADEWTALDSYRYQISDISDEVLNLVRKIREDRLNMEREMV